MNLSIIQIIETNFTTNIQTILNNAKLAQKYNLQYIILDNSESDELLKEIRKIQLKFKIEYIKKEFLNRNQNLLGVLNLITTECVGFIYEFDELTNKLVENLQTNFIAPNFPPNKDNTITTNTIIYSQKLNLNIFKKNKTDKFYNNNYFFIFNTNLIQQILNKININQNTIKDWNIEIFYFYLLTLKKEFNFQLKSINKYLINCLDYETFNNKEIFLAKKYKKEYLKLKYKFAKNIFEKIKIALKMF